MTLSEFKAWFEGLSESMEAPPTEDQWKRIKARVAEINGTATPYPVFVDRYVTPYRRYYDGPLWNGGLVAAATSRFSRPTRHLQRWRATSTRLWLWLISDALNTTSNHPQSAPNGMLRMRIASRPISKAARWGSSP
jgi:hypothetical protein